MTYFHMRIFRILFFYSASEISFMPRLRKLFLGLNFGSYSLASTSKIISVLDFENYFVLSLQNYPCSQPRELFLYSTLGPTILAQQGDTVVVEVKNSLLTENTAIHWHGIRQFDTPLFDGVEGVTQCPILPGDTFVYKFVVDRSGTYLYHAHYGMQREAGLYGSTIVSLLDGVSKPFAYDYDRSIILTDFYHKSTYEQATGLSSIPFGWVGEPRSLLIQGRVTFNCSTPGIQTGLCNATNPECSPYILTVISEKAYRLRISSLTALSALGFGVL